MSESRQQHKAPLPEPLVMAIKVMGGSQSKLAKHLGVSRQALNKWKRVPYRHAQAISFLIQKPLNFVCPDPREVTEEAADIKKPVGARNSAGSASLAA